jgi:uncharacterized protein
MSRACFLDTFAAIAALNPADVHHQRVTSWLRGLQRPLVTTDWVLVEVADGLCSTRTRAIGGLYLRALHADPKVTIVRASGSLFDRALSLYEARDDKDWSLTDCASFIVMQDHGLTEAATADHHFTQAGFVALFE